MTIPPLDGRRVRDLVARFSDQHVLVVGDVMLDRFIVGQVTRISPEAPVPVVRFESEEVRLGGAANVAHNLAAFGASVSLVGVVGIDQGADRMRQALTRSRVRVDGLVEDPGRPTIEKVRIVTGRNQQVARLDYEDDSDVSPAIEERLIEAVRRHGREARMFVVSDYLKGAVSKRLVQTLIEMKDDRIPLIVDPKIPHLECYRGATLVTPNQHEAETATHRRIRTDEDARAGALDFRARAGCEAVLITRGERGMWLSSPEIEGAIPAVARQVSDVTGAGDTVVAAVALALAAGATLAEAAVLANHAAGVVVGKFGTATVSTDELLTAAAAS
jgi:D-beta-D-heptose 7-phosphate kinase/D-beta-D-heptose 1-phosphate adenosyltransferase